LSSDPSVLSFPDPPPSLDPLVEVWPAGKRLLRCHNVTFGATEFNPGWGRGRFHPFTDRYGFAVPTLYAADRFDGALSETVFHGVALGSHSRLVRQAALRPLVVTTLRCSRDLLLAQLHGHGLRRLGVDRRQLIDSEADSYAATARWAQALHHASRRFDGLIWVSRQYDTAFSLVLFGDRVMRRDLDIAEPPLALYVGEGFERVEDAAEAAGITILV
jgi:hypothetical protein